MARDKIAIVTVHGTGDTAEGPEGSKWFQRGSKFSEALRQRLAAGGVEADVVPVLWSGANSASEREKGAEKLARELRNCAKRYGGVHVIGHSHGGNVANEAAVQLRWGRARGKTPIDSLITVGTPFLNLRTSFLQRAAGLLFLALTWGSIVVFPVIVAAMLLDADRPMGPTALLIMFGLIGASLLFMFGISRRGARRILRPRRSNSEAHQVFAIWHENDEAISFLRRIEEVPIEAFPKGSLFRGANSAAIGWGVLVVLIVGLGIPLAYVVGVDLFGLVAEAERATDVSNSMAATMIMLIFAPAVFVLTYILYRFLVGGAAELGARGPLNGFISGVLRGIAMGRDGDQVICNVSPESHTHMTQSAKLEGACAQRMQAAAGAAADKLIEKYRWSLFTVGADTNAPLTNLATDAMTWDSLIHTTYFDQPEVAELIAAHIAGKGR